MKTKHLQFATLAAVGAVLAAGCSSIGYKKQNLTAANIQFTGNLITDLQGKLDTTLTSLNNLVNQPQADLRPQYKTFASNITALQSAAKKLSAARTDIASKEKEYFAEWDQEIAQMQNADIKAISQSRRDEVAKNLASLKTSYAQTDMAFKPFLADLQDVQKYLSVDLTAGGLAAIKDPVAKANQDAGPLKDSLTQLAGDFKKFGDSLSSRTTPQTAQ